MEVVSADTEISIDQLEEVIKRLQNSAIASTPSSRATMVLLDPCIDGTGAASRMYPSMCLVQFTLRQTRRGARIDCTGYFRKQEIEYWWPINVAELAQLQSEVFDGIRHKHDSLQRGTITTIAAIVTRSTGTPRVAIPAVDRAYDLHRDDLWGMVYSMFFPNADNRPIYQHFWAQYLDELLPHKERDEDGVPIAFAGLGYLLTTTKLFAKHNPEASGGRLTVPLERLIQCNDKFAEATEYGSIATVKQYKDWNEEISGIIDDTKGILRSLFENE